MKDRLPLVIGVTGHRDLQNADGPIADAVREYFTQYRAKYPNTPILLLSSLAEGADQLVARTALSLSDDPGVGLELELLVPLPMPEERYLATFGTKNGPENFRALKRRAIRTVVMPDFPAMPVVGPLPVGVSLDDIQFLLAGAYIARNCHVLLAVWDRKEAGGVGGTADVVRFKRTGRLDGLPPAYISALEGMHEVFGTGFDPLEMPDAGPVDCVDFPPEPGRKAHIERLAPHSYDADPDEREQYFKLIKLIYGANIEHFNTDSLRVNRSPGSKWQKEIVDRLPDRMLERLSDSLQNCLATYATADQAALSFQDRLGRMMTRVLILVIAAVLSFGAYAHLVGDDQKPWILAIYLFILIVADLIYIFATKSDTLFRQHRKGMLRHFRGRDDQKRYQDYRTLCEGLRVQFYWRLAGLADSVGDYYLTRQKNELDWIRSSVRSWALLVETPRANGNGIPDERERLRAIRSHWVLDQLNYYIKSAYINRVSQLTFRQTGAGILLASILVSLVVAFLGMEKFRRLNAGVLVFFAFAVAVGVIHFFIKKEEMAEESREDEEELGRIERHVAKRPEIIPPKGITKALRSMWLRPLRRWVGGDGPPRPKMSRLASLAFLYGLAIGLATTLIFLIVSSVLSYLSAPNQMGLKVEITDWLIVTMVLNVAIAALVQWYAEKRAFGVHYRQFRRMLVIFLLAYEELGKIEQQAGDGDAARTLLLRLGREALAEHADWLLLHRDRPIELPKLEL